MHRKERIILTAGMMRDEVSFDLALICGMIQGSLGPGGFSVIEGREVVIRCDGRNIFVVSRDDSNDCERKDVKSIFQYLAYWERYLAAATSETAISNQWSLDRELRTRCRVVETCFTIAVGMKDSRVKQLKLTGKKTKPIYHLSNFSETG